MDIYELAEELHTMYCRFSHMDQCTWEYELHEDAWTKKYSAHWSYYWKARNILDALPDSSPEEIILIGKGIATGLRSSYHGGRG